VATASRSRSSNKSHPRDLGMLAVCLGHQAVEFLRVGAGELGHQLGRQKVVLDDFQDVSSISFLLIDRSFVQSPFARRPAQE
jgi:hypothetical protein